MSETKPEGPMVEFVPFGAEDKVKLSIAIVKNLIAVKTKTGKTCSDNDAIKFIAKCQAKRLNPFEEDCWLIGYDTKEGAMFSFITAHQAFLKRAELHPEYDGMESGVIVRRNDQLLDLEGDFYLPGDELVGGWAKVYFRTRQHPMSKRIRLARFQKPFGIWQEDPAGMIVKCTEADALRSSFPTMCGGMYLREEMEAMGSRDITTGTVAPIFKSPESTVQSPQSAESPSTINKKPSTKKQDTTKEIINRMVKANLTESILMEFLGVVGLVDKQQSIAELPEETRAMILEKWPDFLERIRQTPPPLQEEFI
jgi:phage recombination protein Bet